MVSVKKSARSGRRTLYPLFPIYATADLSPRSRRGEEKNRKKVLDNFRIPCYNDQAFGGVAQLGERLNGIQEVIGSIPTVSTKIALN